jgi:MscS family membrane protein
MHSIRIRWGVAWLVLLGVSLAARADDSESPLSTPRSSLELFLNTTRAGRYEQAAQVFPEASHGRADLARELRAVLDEYLKIDLNKVPDTIEGTTVDIGRIPTGGGREPVRLMRDSSERWVFTPTTLARVPAWYAGLPDQWIRQRLPEPLLRAGPQDVLWWQWIALVPIALLAFGAGVLLAWLIRLLLRPLARRLALAPHRLQRLAGPLVLLVSAFVGAGMAGRLFFTLPAQAFMGSLQSALVLVAVYWGALRCIDIAIDALRSSPFAKGSIERLTLLPLFSKGAKIGLAVIAVVQALQKFGYPVASLIAGLGVGGLAVALAAQKTVADLFGSVVLGIDQPFRPGDFVKIEDLSGTVETVGLRSTRIRTPGRTLVTIPNGKLADLRIESFAPRDRIRLDFTLSLARSTSAAQIRQVLTDVESYLRTVRLIHSDPPTVYLTTLGASSFDIAIGFSVDTRSDDTFQKTRQTVLLEILAIVERNGTRLAIPPREVRMEVTSGALPSEPADARAPTVPPRSAESA